MKWQFMISLRYLFEKRREKFISVTALIAILGIAVGVAALIVTMAVMNGFNNEITEKILNVNPHVIIGSTAPIKDPKSVIDTVTKIDDVTEGAEFLDGQALIKVKENIMGILVRGVHADPKKRLTRIETYLTSGSADLAANSVVIGSELASTFGLKAGDSISIISPVSAQTKAYRINGIFSSGRYDYDLNLIFINIEEAGTLFQKQGMAGGIGVKIKDAFKVDIAKQKIQAIISPPYWVRTWKDIERNLFSALKLEKVVMFLVMALIVCVACFNIISTLIMTVMQKTKDIGILKAIGVTRFGIMGLFLLEGLYIGIIGIILGSGLGLGICHLQSKYELIKLPPDVYYIYSVPVQVKVPDTLLIIAAAFVLGLIATIYPSMHASRLNPVDALRYE